MWELRKRNSHPGEHAREELEVGKHMSREEFARRVRDDEAIRRTAAALEADDRQRQEHLTDEHELQRWIGEGGNS